MDLLVILKDNLVPFLVILTVLVFVHEMGHYLVARRNGVRVEVFSIGFGPELFGWNDRTGTRWKISAIPLGGYVKMFGDADPASTQGSGLDVMSDQDRAVSFHHKRLGQRTAIVLAGPAANFLFAIVLLAGLYSIVGQRYAPPSVDVIVPASAAEAAGLRVGDLIVEVDAVEITRFDELQRIVRDNPGVALDFLVERNGKLVGLTATPRRVERTDALGNTASIGLLGVQSEQMQMIRHDPLSALWLATTETWSLVRQTLNAVGQMIVGARTTDELGGPLRIAQLSGTVAEAGLVTTIWFTALLSINLGLINLFPIPVLDGGHLMFYLAEAVRGRPLGERVQEIASMAGLTMVIALMVFVTWNDLVQLRVFEFFGSLFS
jgi:regulator of sigma E protease